MQEKLRNGTEVDLVDRLDLIWGAHEIGRVINRTPRQVVHMLAAGTLPAKKIGGRWCVSRTALNALFSKRHDQGAAA